MVAGLMAGLGAAAVAQGEHARVHAPPEHMPTVSRGKNKTRTHDNGGTRANQRAALKKRNKARHRKACR